MSDADIARLPKRIPWLRATSDAQTHLGLLRTALALPLEKRGLVCVDFVDMIAVLANGGEVRLTQASAPTASLACDALFSDDVQREWIATANAAVCLHIRVRPGFTMSDFDLIGNRLESCVSEQALIVLSTGMWDGDGVELTLLAVSTRE